jgi:glycosyltransferase involved in cell wall biosynthesis
MMMRVALIDPSLFTLPYDVGLVQGLRDNGLTVDFYGRAVAPGDGDPGAILVNPAFYRLSRVYGRLPKLLRLALKGVDHAFSLAAMLRDMRRVRPDIIHFQWFPLPALDRLVLQRFRKIAPVVLTVHDTDPFNGDPAAGLQRLGFRAALEACDRLIVHTRQGEARLLAMGLDARKIVVLPHGPLGPVVARRAGGDAAMCFVLFGKIKPYKGADVLIEAFAALAPSLRDQTRVRIVGQAYMDLAPLRQLTVARGVAGRVSIEDCFVSDAEIGHIFDDGSIAVFPYREIEASGVLSLAIAHGRPMIASRLGLFAEALQDGVHGRLVPADDVAALSAAMAEMIADGAFTACCAQNVERLADDLPDWTEIGAMTARLYGACLQGPVPVAGALPRQLVKEIAS